MNLFLNFVFRIQYLRVNRFKKHTCGIKWRTAIIKMENDLKAKPSVSILFLILSQFLNYVKTDHQAYSLGWTFSKISYLSGFLKFFLASHLKSCSCLKNFGRGHVHLYKAKMNIQKTMKRILLPFTFRQFYFQNFLHCDQ